MILNSSSDREYSLLIDERPGVVIPYLIILTTAAVSGTFGNMMVMATILMSQGRSRGVGNIFIFNLASSDIIVTALINPFSVIGKLQFSYATMFYICIL